MTDTPDMPAWIQSLTKPQVKHLLAAQNGDLTQDATTRCILSARPEIVDYSFRPARITPLGKVIRDALVRDAQS